MAVERQRLERAITPLQAKGLVQLHWLEGATWRDLQRAMRREQWHIFHFVGHGNFDPQRDEGMIAFCNDANKAHLLPAGDLGRLLADQRTLRLVVLNACLGAQGSNRDLFSSTAATLVRRGIPAVVAMQQAITDAAAIEFTQTFYESLADGLPVDAAMSEARKAISFALTNTLEWGTPVLYSRASDGQLFDVVAVASTSSATAGQAPVEPAEATQETPQQKARIQDISANLPGRGEVNSQNQQPAVAPSRKVEDARYGIATMAASASRWRQLGLWATLFVIALLVGMVSFRSQLAEMFGLAAPGVLPATVTVVATTVTPLPADGDKFTLDAFAMTFAYVSAGAFTMGSPSREGSANEHPQHRMSVNAFWIGLTEVTNAQYKQFIDAGGYSN